MNYRDLILQRLKEQTSKSDQFSRLINSYSELIDKVAALTTQNNRLLMNNADSFDPQSKTICDLKAELSDVYKKKAQNDQQLIETNNRLQKKENEYAFLNNRCDTALKSVVELNAKHHKLIDSNQHLYDEYLALQAAYNGLEHKHRQTQEELTQLIARWTAFKTKEVDFYNEQNDTARKQREMTLRNDIEEASIRQVAVVDDKAFEFVGNSPTKSSVAICDVLPNRCLLRFEAHDGDINAVRWHPSGRQFATGGADRKIKLFEMHDGNQQLRATFSGSNQALMAIDFDQPGEQVLGASSDFAIRLWTLTDQRCRHCLTGHSGKVFTARFRLQATQVVSGSHDRTLKLWDLRSRRCSRTLFAGSTVHDVATNDGSETGIISGHFDKKLRFWDVRSETVIHDVTLAGKITSLDLSLDGNHLLCCTRDDLLCLFDLRNNRIVHTYCAESFRLSCDYSRAVLSPNMEYCAAGSSDGHVFIWNVRSTKIEKILNKGHDAPVLACSWHPQGQSLLSVDRHKTVCLWG